MKMITNDSIANLSQDKETSKASNPDKQQSDPSAIENEFLECSEPTAKKPHLDVRDGDVSETQYERLKEDEKQYQEEAGNDVRGLDVQCCNPTIQITRADPRACLWSLDLCPEWDFPKTKQEKLKYTIFKDLWEKGYFLASGAKFGGDLAIVHSHYVALVKDWEEPMSLFEVISSGRLGTKVKKNALFCSVDSNGKPVYFSAQWTGIV
jgi:tRNA-splicing endonuclease subunit Sen34